MSDQHRDLLLKVAELRELVDAATLTPWRVLEFKETWSLYGKTRDFKGKLKDGEVPSMQILKAPKTGTPYAEYWPNAEDSMMILESVNRFSFWLDWAEDVLNRHFPVVCSCGIVHFLCAAHRTYQWEECPEVIGVVKAIEKLH